MELFIKSEFKIQATSSLEALDKVKEIHDNIYYIHVKPIVKYKEYSIVMFKYNTEIKDKITLPIKFKGNNIYDFLSFKFNY